MSHNRKQKKSWSLLLASLVMLAYGQIGAAANSQFIEEGQLSDYSFDNRVQMVIDDYQNHPKGIKLIMKTEKKGHLDTMPIHLDLKIQCEGQKKVQVIDVVTLLKQSGSDVAQHYNDLFSPFADVNHPNGQLRFCAFESLNFDQKSILLKVLKGKSGGGCEQSFTVDFQIPITTYCKR